MTNHEISEILDFIAGVIEVHHGNPYRAAAYANAAATINTLNVELKDLFKQKSNFDDLPSIGESLAKKLNELFTTGDIKSLEKYVTNVPEIVFELQKLHGLGVKKALFLTQKFNLKTKADMQKLLKLAQQGEISKLPHWGTKSEADLIEILSGQFQKTRLPYAQAKKIADLLVTHLKKCSAVKQIAVLGSLRRLAPTIGDVDLGLTVTDSSAVKKCLQELPEVKRLVIAGENMFRLELKSGEQVDLKIVDDQDWGSFLQHFTGSKEHNIKLREYALRKQLSLSEYGIKDLTTKKIHHFDTETDFYKFLGLKLIPPKERIGGNEIEKYQL